MFKQRGTKKTGLNILIIGCGKVGTALTSQLCKEGHDITVIDKNAEKVEMNVNQYDVMGVNGNGASYSVFDGSRCGKCGFGSCSHKFR